MSLHTFNMIMFLVSVITLFIFVLIPLLYVLIVLLGKVIFKFYKKHIFACESGDK